MSSDGRRVGRCPAGRAVGRRPAPGGGAAHAGAGDGVGGVRVGGVRAGAGGGDAGDTLLHLVVPSDEVRTDGAGIVVRSSSARRSGTIAELIRSGSSEPESVQRIAVPLDDTGDYRAATAAALVELWAIRGSLEEVILSRRVPVLGDVDLVAAFVAGWRANFPACSFLLDLSGVRATGFGTETVAEVTSDGLVTTRLLADTRARTNDPAADARLRTGLLRDPKEIHEHAVSVKLAVDEIGSVCDDLAVRDCLSS